MTREVMLTLSPAKTTPSVMIRSYFSALAMAWITSVTLRWSALSS